jgi:hypothetical protein
MLDASIPVNGFEAGADCAPTDANDIATAPTAAKAKFLTIALTSTLFESLIEYQVASVQTQRTPFGCTEFSSTAVHTFAAQRIALLARSMTWRCGGSDHASFSVRATN